MPSNCNAVSAYYTCKRAVWLSLSLRYFGCFFSVCCCKQGFLLQPYALIWTPNSVRSVASCFTTKQTIVVETGNQVEPTDRVWETALRLRGACLLAASLLHIDMGGYMRGGVGRPNSPIICCWRCVPPHSSYLNTMAQWISRTSMCCLRGRTDLTPGCSIHTGVSCPLRSSISTCRRGVRRWCGNSGGKNASNEADPVVSCFKLYSKWHKGNGTSMRSWSGRQTGATPF